MKENDMVKLSFSYTDEFGQITSANKIISTTVFMNGDYSDLELLVDEFKRFLILKGHLQDTVNKIQFIEE